MYRMIVILSRLRVVVFNYKLYSHYLHFNEMYIFLFLFRKYILSRVGYELYGYVEKYGPRDKILGSLHWCFYTRFSVQSLYIFQNGSDAAVTRDKITLPSVKNML